ncbi:MAG: hypothetical protein ACOYU2_05830, partial [Nitrospirota bacterium]
MVAGLRIKILLSSILLIAVGCSMYEFKDPTGAQIQIAYETPEQGKSPVGKPQKQKEEPITDDKLPSPRP